MKNYAVARIVNVVLVLITIAILITFLVQGH
jgi:hypothetical protein